MPVLHGTPLACPQSEGRKNLAHGASHGSPRRGVRMSRVLILAYGNPLRGDDAFGWRVAERLLELPPDPSVEILRLHQLTPELMDPLSRADLALFIDRTSV